MWADIVLFFENQSATANFLQITSATIATVALAYKGYKEYRNLVQVTTISKWINTKTKQQKNAKSLKIAIVDDRLEDYPIDSLRKLGYTIKEIDHLALPDVPSLLSYDCIFLDINGVLEEDPRRGGLEVLKRLKVPKGPYVVAVSSRGFDITMSEFFMMADHRLKKPIPRVDVEGVIENAYALNFSAEHAAKRIDTLANFTEPLSSTSKKIIRAILKHINSGKNENELRRQLSLTLTGKHVDEVISDINLIRRQLGVAP